jgi:spectinomycin phosphotransferase
MLEKPEIDAALMSACLQAEYGLISRKIDFLPLGADLNTAVYRVETLDGLDFFMKLRRGAFHQAGVSVPKYLADIGIRQIIAPLPTRTGVLWAKMAPFTLILYPFIEGQNGFEKSLSDQQWVEFGQAMKMFHSARIPAGLTQDVPRETFSARFRDSVRLYLERCRPELYNDPAARDMAAFLKIQREETLNLVARAEWLARRLLANPPAYILCHADIHAWNLLIDRQDHFYMVDWDTLIFAPKERDLMFIGSGLGGNRLSPAEEINLFYQGYGQAGVDQAVIAYYRYERIIEDIAVYCEQIFMSDEGGADREQAVEYLKFNYLPEGTIEIARRFDSGE